MTGEKVEEFLENLNLRSSVRKRSNPFFVVVVSIFSDILKLVFGRYRDRFCAVDHPPSPFECPMSLRERFYLSQLSGFDW